MNTSIQKDTVTTTSAARSASPFRLGRLAVLAVVATVGNALLYVIGSATGASMTAQSAGTTQAIPLALAVGATLVPLLLAGAVTWLIAHRFSGFRRVAQWLGLAVALLSMVSPFVAAVDLATAITLALMHVVAGAAWFSGLAPQGRSVR